MCGMFSGKYFSASVSNSAEGIHPELVFSARVFSSCFQLVFSARVFSLCVQFSGMTGIVLYIVFTPHKSNI